MAGREQQVIDAAWPNDRKMIKGVRPEPRPRLDYLELSKRRNQFHSGAQQVVNSTNSDSLAKTRPLDRRADQDAAVAARDNDRLCLNEQPDRYDKPDLSPRSSGRERG